ncbi:MAG: Holliday junction branch migration protein RuvA [Defluviitaleaceae bacterium]|nr:Holliday junction branch migration protein RuvA [Defluviitaleaceae bacterium]
MIAYIKGPLAYVLDNAVVVEANGVGYHINVSTSTLSRLPSRGAEVQLFTYMQVSENGQSLHGFITQEEIRLFTLLISVSGIGPRVASAILATMSPSQLIISIVADDVAALSKAPGVGKKTAQRVLLELRDKIKTAAGSWDDSPQESFAVGGSLGQKSEKQDAMDALLALGYGRAEAMQVVLETAEEGMTADQIIRASLKKFTRKSP